jgi:hypothetical protein
MNFGNPKLKSFKTTFIRRVIVDNIYVWVNKEIIPQTEELLCRAVERGVSFEGRYAHTIQGYDGESPLVAQNLGLYIKFDSQKNLQGIEEGLGFIYKEGVFIYDPTAEVDKTILPSFEDVAPTKIGSRQLKLGAKGIDVKFINLYCGLTSNDLLVFNKETEESVLYLQTRLGIPQNGIVDWYTWQSIIPNLRTRLSGGSAGPKVRACQSALRCFGYNTPTTSRFGTETLRSVRQFQEQHNLRTTGRIGDLELQLFFDYH